MFWLVIFGLILIFAIYFNFGMTPFYVIGGILVLWLIMKSFSGVKKHSNRKDMHDENWVAQNEEKALETAKELNLKKSVIKFWKNGDSVNMRIKSGEHLGFLLFIHANNSMSLVENTYEIELNRYWRELYNKAELPTDLTYYFIVACCIEPSREIQLLLVKNDEPVCLISDAKDFIDNYPQFYIDKLYTYMIFMTQMIRKNPKTAYEFIQNSTPYKDITREKFLDYSNFMGSLVMETYLKAKKEQDNPKEADEDEDDLDDDE